MATREQWDATWEELGRPPPEGVYEKLMACYAESHRRYHTARHLEECFAELAGVRSGAERLGEVELALWFHDAIYDTTRHDNEERSAEWARSVVAQAGLEASVGDSVASLIMATRHDAVPAGADARLVVDVDLSILGTPPLRFDEYERDIRAEYRWVPDVVFRRKRRKILRGFLERPELFNTPRMREAHERPARANLERSLARLKPDLRLPCDVAMAFAGIAVIVGLARGFAVALEWATAAAAVVWLLYYLVIRPRLYRPPVLALAPGKPVDSRYAVTCDDEGIAVTFDDKPAERIRWADVTAVLIRIDDSFLPQPWWIVRGASGGCIYPNDARGAALTLTILPSRLPGFDYTAVIKAMGMMTGGVVVWDATRAAAIEPPRSP